MNLLQKLADFALKSVMTLVISGTGYQFLDGKWFGQVIFRSYLSQESLTLLTPPISDDLYSAFGSDGLISSIGQLTPFRLLLSIVLMLALLAHVLFKRNVAIRSNGNRPVRSSRSGWQLRAQSIYQTQYYLITLAIFGVLLTLFILAPLRVAVGSQNLGTLS